MKKMFKKSIAMLIAVLMVISTMPFTALTAFADTASDKAYIQENYKNGAPEYATTTTTSSHTLSNHSDYMKNIIVSGNYNQLADDTYDQFDSTTNRFNIASHGVDKLIAIYDTDNADIRIPVAVEAKEGNAGNNVNIYVGFDHVSLDNGGQFSLGNSTWKRANSWIDYYDNNDNSHDFSSDRNGNVDRAENTANGRFLIVKRSWAGSLSQESKQWKNYIKFTPDSAFNNNYYASLTTLQYNVQFDATLNWTSWGSSSNYNKSTAGVAVSYNVINYAPLKEIMNSQELKDTFEKVSANENNYESNSVADYYSAVAALFRFNLTDGLTTDTVSSKAAQIKTLVDNYNTAKNNLKFNYTFKKTNGESKVIAAKSYDSALAAANLGFAPTAATEKTYKDNNKHAWTTYAWPESVASGVYEVTEIPTENTEGHTPGEAKEENRVEATCGTDGSYDKVIYCTVCNAEISREKVTIPATGNHSYGSAQQYSETQHKYVCSVCGDEKFEDHNIVNGKCTVCGYSALNMDAYNAAHNEAVLTMAETDKYTSDSMAAYKSAVVAASDKINSATTQAEVDAITSEIISAKTLLAKATVTVKFVVNNDDTDTSTTVTKTAAWGESVHLDTESNYVSKWTISVNGTTSNMATTASAIDHVATEDATITAYVSNDETEAVKYSKVTFIGKNSAVVGIKYVAAGTTVATNTLLTAPVIPFYEDGQWDKAEIVADGSDITVRATYVPKAVDENKCGIHFNGETKYYNYDSYVYLFSADKSKKYAMYADEAGTELITYFDGVDFYAPRRDNLYIKEVADTSAMTQGTIGFTGSYKQDTTSSFNVKFWLPEGATLVETGVDLKATFPNGTVATAHDRATKFSQRNEYTYTGKFGTGKKSIEFKPYLTYMLNGKKTTVYSTSQTVEFN